nr:RluA family pseudouridine synthase [Helicobacter suis]
MVQIERTFTAMQEERLDTFLTKSLGVAKNRILQCIKSSRVQVNDKTILKGGLKLKIGDEVVLKPSQAPLEVYKPTDLKIEILYEDEDILVLNKPPYLAMHPAISLHEPTLVDYLQAKGVTLSTLSGESRCGIVHRLDKNTSGAVVIAKNNATHANLATQLQIREMGRYYLALITEPLKKPMRVECHLGRHPKNRLKMTNLDTLRQNINGGRYSKTDFIPLLSNARGIQLIAAKLYSGRTHQVRAHLESLGRHILGDSLYGKKDNYKGRILLHAYLLYMTHPTSQEKLLFKAQILEDMVECLEKEFQGVAWDGLIRENYILDLFNTTVCELFNPS